ncbi:MAG: electron transfer flavoprotein subunit alpha [Candidatus Lokiarchaeota archaeon]|nr:electron transfer flavoprotein subunit alpha [Candidatus Lokiarchaeota archaeon]
MLQINTENCIGCKICEQACPYGAIIIDAETKKAKVLDNCTLCGSCINVCRYNALSIKREMIPSEDLNKFKGIIIFGELEDNNGPLEFKKVVYELLSKAIELNKDLNEPISVVVLGPPGLSGLIDDLFYYGADIVYLCEHELLKEFSNDGYTTVLTSVIIDNKPSIVLYGATIKGRELAPRIAARLNLGLTADCTGLSINTQKQLVQTRPAFGGNIMASILSPYTRPQMATVRPNTFSTTKLLEPQRSKIEKIKVKLERQNIRTKIIGEFSSKTELTNIEDADILISVGRGIGNKENIKLIQELAQELNGSISSSRALVELGWTDHPIQVGQSGKTVSPKVYFALGISGAIQHLVGMQTSDIIIAINSDPEAPIFKVADFGIVGDLFEIIPQFLKLCRNNKESLI